MPNGLPADHPFLIALRLNQMRTTLGQPSLPLPPTPPGFAGDDVCLSTPAARPPRPRATPPTIDAVDRAAARMLTRNNVAGNRQAVVDPTVREAQVEQLTADAGAPLGVPVTYADQALAALREQVSATEAALAQLSATTPLTAA